MEIIILASASPRRSRILSQMGLPFEVRPVDVDEQILPGTTVSQAERLAEKKCGEYVRNNLKRDQNWVLGADTLIDFDGRAEGKPETEKDAEGMISELSGKKHSVITALALYNRRSGETIIRHRITEITFADLSSAEIERYIKTGEWNGAAGGYRIQGRGSILINSLNGSYSNVMGLPIRLFYEMLLSQNYIF